MTSIATSGRNVLAELDKRVPTSFYWSLTLLATLGGFLFGYDTANIGSALPFVPYDLSGFALGYLVAGASLGAAAGALLAGPLADRFGRKSLLIADALIEVFPVWQTGIGLGWIMVCFAVTCLIAIAFVHRFLPETKNRSVEEVVEIFEREAEGGHGASGPLARGAAAA
jgi:SP family arabinose:H+ symporter-like MFS transporter